MPFNPSVLPNLRRVFNQGFSVHDIAEPLVSFDKSFGAKEVREFMTARAFEVVGARDEGLVIGYLVRKELGEGTCGDFVRTFEEDIVIDDTAPLAEVVLGLQDSARLFVSLLGRVGAIVTRSDLQKPPVRMWLFGMITLLEVRFTRLIEETCPDGAWRQFLSAGRIKKAEELLAERTRRNQQIGLLDCLQFSDKGQIIARNEEIRGRTLFESRRQIEVTIKQLERLRNNLAHSQDIISGDWETIVALSENLDRVLEGPRARTPAADA